MKLLKALFLAFLLACLHAEAAVKLSPVFNSTQEDNSGHLASGFLVYTYAAGSTTPQTTYTDSTGVTPQANPIVLNARGEPTNAIWLTTGQTYKFILKDASNNLIRTIDNVSGVNDATITQDQWLAGPTPTYVSATQFTLLGDQTSTFAVGRRLKLTVTAGTVYGTITVSAFTTLTTVTVVVDTPGALDSGLSAVSYGLLSSTNISIPRFIAAGTGISITYGVTGGPIVSNTITAPDPGIAGTNRNLGASVVTDSATVTFTASEVLMETSAHVSFKASTYSQALNLGTTGAGGMDTGTAPVSGFIAVYSIAKADGTTSVLACAVATSTGIVYGGANMPSGYTYSGLLAILPTNGSSQVQAGYLLDRKWSYYTAVNVFSGQTGGTSLTSQTLVSKGVPATARTVDVIVNGTTNSGTMLYSVAGDARGTGAQSQVIVGLGGAHQMPAGITNSTGSATFRDVPLITAQTIYWMDSNGNTTDGMWTVGYSF